MSDSSLLEKLNSEQRKAVQHFKGPLLVFAGAGSGKTRVITYRIAYLIKEKKVMPNSILAVTFTKKAAGEMKERVVELLSEEGINVEDRRYVPVIGTFHSICAQILRIDGEKVDLRKNFTILDQSDSESIVKELMFDQNIDIKQFKPKAVLSAIQSAKNDLISADKYLLHHGGYFDDIVSSVYEQYEKRLVEVNAVDFADLLFKVGQLFESDKKVLEKYQRKYSFILVDEYQDTNKVQYKIVKSLGGKEQNICVVGDDDQGIYKWRGADIKNIIDFQKDYPAAEIVKLEQNYRSCANILSAAGAVIKRNNERVEKSLWTDKDSGEKISIYQASDSDDEVSYILEEIESLKRAGYQNKDIAVLYRTNYQSRAIEEGFLQNRIKYQLVGGFRFYDRKEIKDILSYLKFISNTKDTVSLSRVINIPSRKVGSVTFSKMISLSKRVGIELGELMCGYYWSKNSDLPIDGFPENSIKKIEENIGECEKYDSVLSLFGGFYFNSLNKNVAEIIRDIMDRINYREFINDGTDNGAYREENVGELVTVATIFDNQHGLLGQSALLRFLEGIALLEDTDSLDKEDSSAVTLMTIHSSKGLEFPVVFLAGMEEGLLPHGRSLSDQTEIEEERRLCYVGITRAKERLYMSFAKSRIVAGGVDYSRVPSRFLGEIPQDICEYYVSDNSPDYY